LKRDVAHQCDCGHRSNTAGISVAIIAVVQGLGTNLKNTFSSVSTALK
jgi:hypothetical protein